MFLEISYRKGWLTWDAWLPLLLVVPLALLVDISVWKNITSGATFIQSLVWFSAAVNTGRVLASFFVLHDPVTWQTIVAAMALLLAAGVRLV